MGGIYRGAGGTGDATADSASEALLIRELAVEVQADADAAAASATSAAVSAATASTAATNAQTAETNAETAEVNAELAETNAEAAQAAAEAAQLAAETAQTAAELAETNAEAAQAAAEIAKTAAELAETNAETAETNAELAETNAETAASAAAASATNAATSETNAAASATSAASSATSASGSATSASSSASSASTSATNAAASSTSAAGSATTATTQAGIASTSAANAATSETNAASSASAASTSASNAATSASNAATSATNASNSATAASGFADDASDSADAAAASATLAATYTPDQTGHAGEFLTTDGSVTSWATVDASLMKNRIINGACVIDQRNAGASVTQIVAATYPVDRFYVFGSVTSKFTAQQNAGAVTPPAGFRNYLGMTSSSAYSVGASELFFVAHKIEGFNVADLGWGTANAKTVTLSFWVRSSLTGTFGGSITNGAGNRSYPFTYTISAANTWEQKSITIAGDTSGTWVTNNGSGLELYFNMGTGSTVSGTAGAWSGSTFYSATGATSVVGTNGATFYITGVQLEKGSQATSFEYRQYGQELALCQRYYAKLQNDGAGDAFLLIGSQISTTSVGLIINHPVTMRAEPTVAFSNVSITDLIAWAADPTLTTTYAGYDTSAILCSIAANGAQYRPIYMSIKPNTTGNLTLSSEL